MADPVKWFFAVIAAAVGLLTVNIALGGFLYMVIDDRLDDLATKEQLAALAETVATKDELAALAATAATKEQLAALAATAATKEQLAALAETTATKEQLAALAETTATKEQLAALAETTATKEQFAALAETTATKFNELDARVTTLGSVSWDPDTPILTSDSKTESDLLYFGPKPEGTWSAVLGQFAREPGVNVQQVDPSYSLFDYLRAQGASSIPDNLKTPLELE